MVGNCVAPSRFRRYLQGCVGQRQHAVEFGQRAHGFGGHRVGDRVAVGAEHAAFERRAILARSPHQPYAVKMDRERELKIIRRAYAKQVTAVAGVGDPQVEAAFAAVARENFLGPGPWHIVRWGGGYRATPDADPIYLYTDDVIGILPKRNLNNGQPSLDAALIAAAAPQPSRAARRARLIYWLCRMVNCHARRSVPSCHRRILPMARQDSPGRGHPRRPDRAPTRA
jgi:hypothetical protein